MTPETEAFIVGLSELERDALSVLFEVAEQERLDPLATLLGAAAGAEGELREALVGVLDKIEAGLGADQAIENRAGRMPFQRLLCRRRGLSTVLFSQT